MLESYKKVYKNFLKRKINLTTATMVAILVSSNVFAGELGDVGLESLDIATGNVTIEIGNKNGIWGALVKDDSNMVTIQERFNGLIGIFSEGNENTLTAEKINAALGIISTGDGNTITAAQINAALGILSNGNGNEIVNLEKINAAVGIIIGGDANLVTSNKINAALGILVAGSNGEIASNNTVTVENYINALVGVLMNGDKNTLINNGDINAIVGADIRGTNSSVENNGQIIALDAILASGSGHNVTNNGDIYGIFNGIKLEGEKNTAINNGTIIGLNPMEAVGTGNSLINGAEGTILGLRGMAVTGESNSIDNRGTIISAGVAGFGGNGIVAEGTGNRVTNSGAVIAIGAFGDSAAIKNSGDNTTISNSGALIGASVNLVEKDLVLGGSTVIASEGKNVNISNEAGGFIISVGSEGKPSIAITSKGDGGKVENKGTLAAVGLEISDLANLGDIIGGEEGVDIDALLKILLANEGSGTGILSEGDGKQLSNSGTMLAGAGIDSTGDDNRINNAGTMVVTDAITSVGANNIITNTGTLTADKGIESIGSGNTITNNLGNIIAKEGIISVGDNNNITHMFTGIGSLGTGTITSDLGISSTGDNNTIKNIGKIAGKVGISVVGDDNTIINTKEKGSGILAPTYTGSIVSDLAIEVTGDRNSVTNTESINGNLGITMVGADNTVDNSGNITLKAGDNSFGIKLAGTGSGTVTNSGTVAVAGENSTAIEVIGMEDALITNSKTITAEGTGIAGVRAHAYNVNMTNSGDMTLTGDEAVALDLMGINIVADNSKNITVTGDNSVGVSLEARNILMTNEGTISVAGLNAVGIDAFLHTEGRAVSSITNNGTINVTGENARGINAYGNLTATNNGDINVKGTDGIGILAAGGATGINNGVITIGDITSKGLLSDGKGSHVVNKGTIKVDHITAAQVTQEELDQIKQNAIGGVKEGTSANDGVIKNANDQVIYAGGDHIIAVYGEHPDFFENSIPGKYEIGDMELDKAVRTDLTVVVTGTQLNGILNANGVNNDYPAFDENISEGIEKFLVEVENLTMGSALNINGTLNGADYGVLVGDGSSVNLNGTINASKTAVALSGNSTLNIAGSATGGKVNGDIDFRGDATLNSDGGVIIGDITSSTLTNGTVNLGNGTILDGNINLAGGNSNVSITDGSIFTGNISLGSGGSSLTIDSSSGNLISSGSLIDGGDGKDELNIGTSNEITIIKGTIQNFESQNLYGTVFLDAEANILTGISSGETSLLAGEDKGAGNIVVDGDFVLGIKNLEDGSYNHALTDIAGNEISGNGTLWADTRNLNIGKAGISIDLEGTFIGLGEDQLKATQFIYNVTLGENNLKYDGNSILNIDIIKDVTDLGVNNRYQDVWNSILAADAEGVISNTTTYGQASDLEYLMYQAKERNIYTLGTKLAYDSMKLAQFGTESFVNSPAAEQWIVQAKGIGSYDSSRKSTEFNTTGAIVAGEYGMSSTTSVGLSFAGVNQEAKFDGFSSKLEADTFHFGIYGKHSMDNFRFMAGAGYQFGNVDATNVSVNAWDRFENRADVDNRGFNLFGKIAYDYELGNGFKLVPNGSISAQIIKQDSADEGDKDWAISIDSRTVKSYDFKAGVDLAKEFAAGNGKGELVLNLAQQFTAGDIDKDFTARFNGEKTSDYTVDGFQYDKNLTAVGAGVNLEYPNGFMAGANYGFEFNGKSKNHKVGVGLGYKF